MTPAIICALSMTLQAGQEPISLSDVALQDMIGATVRTSSFLGKKVILFNWASW
ncbi:hypothetical protein QPK87_13900 [Kamptonema cortianum]|nr:hypothetical protein [Kamptonema cortianum]